MDRRLDYTQRYDENRTSSIAATLAYGFGLLYIVHQALLYFNYPVLSARELLWNALVHIAPKHLLLDCARRQELEANGMLSQTHAAKSDALRKMLGLGSSTLLQKLPVEGIMRRASGFTLQQPTSNVPPGLGNWDNSCYQNSVLQGLASLDNLKQYLRQSDNGANTGKTTTTESLLETIGKLNDPYNNGKQLWIPAKLKSMSSWQQQDAQEYFSKVMDELDKEAAEALAASQPKPGLEGIVEDTEPRSQQPITSENAATDLVKASIANVDQHNPLDGLLAQRVACTRCGYSEGLSMIPFNCLTLPLGSNQYAYNLGDCLDEYAKLEEISDVECSKCTLLRAEQQLTQMLPSPPCYRSTNAEPPVDSKILALPPEIRAQAFKRLRAIQQALEDDDFADMTLNETCQIPKKARVSSTKTRQAVIGRAPQTLVVHLNRSVFDETTGVQRKNYANVRYPLLLDLKSWMLSAESTGGEGDDKSTSSMLPSNPAPGVDTESVEQEVKYRIKAVVTHYGRHENGHYICYRQHPAQPQSDLQNGELDELEPDDKALSSQSQESHWWRLSDDDVTSVSEDDVLGQGGVFMLFYERELARENIPQLRDARISTPEPKSTAQAETSQSQDTELEEAIAVALPPPILRELDIPPENSPASTTAIHDNSDTTTFKLPLAQVLTAPPSEATSTDDEFEPDETLHIPLQALPKPARAPLMRTARSRQMSRSENRFAGNAFRAVAAT